jgi:hypothetical protein
VPFVGIVARALEGEGGLDALFGPPRGAIYGKFAVGEAPAGSTSLNLPLLGRSIRLMLRWKLSGRGWPHPFFDRATGSPLHPLEILTAAQREALRPLCGPRPAPAR